MRFLRTWANATGTQADVSVSRFHRLGAIGVIYTAGLAIFGLAGAYWGLTIKRSMLFAQFDGAYERTLAIRQINWHLPLTYLSGDFFQGMGDLFFPINARLFPSFQLLAKLGDSDNAVYVMYLWMLGEIVFAILLLSRSLAIRRPAAVLAAALTLLAIFPFRKYGLVYFGIYAALAPHLGTAIAAALVTGAAFFYFGRRGIASDLLWGGIILALLFWFLVGETYGFIIAAPFIALCALAAVISAQGRQERYKKLGLIGAISIVFVAAGPAKFLAGFLFDTAATFFSPELVNDRATLHYGSILFQWDTIGKTGPLLVVAGAAGMLVASFDRRRPALRIFGLVMLAYLAARLVLAVLLTYVDFWRGPSPVYLEFFVIPVYFLYAVWLAERTAMLLWRSLAPERAFPWAAIETGGTILCAALAVIFSSNPNYAKWTGYIYPPAPTALTQTISNETRVDLGSAFLGRTINMVGRSVHKPLQWLNIHDLDDEFSEFSHNDHRASGLNYYGVPAFFEYTSTITPAFYALTTRLLAVPWDGQMRASAVFRNIDPRTLALLGVRFVVTDAPFTGAAKLRQTMAVAEGMTLYLYEISNPNLGHYSPVTVTTLATATGIVQRLADPAFDGANEILVTEDLGKLTLVQARNSRLLFEGASVRIQAESAGRSIVLIPLEFSSCLSAARTSGDPDFRVFRANLLETGVLFQGKVDLTLTFRNGPFTKASCRLQDRAESKKLGIGNVPAIVRPPTDPGMQWRPDKPYASGT